MTEILSDDWYCPTCKAYVSGESVSFEEEHVVCGTFIGEVWQETKASLLTAVRAGTAYKETLAKFGREPEGTYHVGDELLLDDWTDALAALPEHLRGEI